MINSRQLSLLSAVLINRRAEFISCFFSKSIAKGPEIILPTPQRASPPYWKTEGVDGEQCRPGSDGVQWSVSPGVPHTAWPVGGSQSCLKNQRLYWQTIFARNLMNLTGAFPRLWQVWKDVNIFKNGKATERKGITGSQDASFPQILARLQLRKTLCSGFGLEEPLIQSGGGETLDGAWVWGQNSCSA